MYSLGRATVRAMVARSKEIQAFLDKYEYEIEILDSGRVPPASLRRSRQCSLTVLPG